MEMDGGATEVLLLLLRIGCSHVGSRRVPSPLLRSPEFWRAAPEEALLWGSDELGFPPSPRGGSLDLGAAEGVSSWAAAGHMRAAGLRL